LSSIGKVIPLPVPVPDWSKPIILVLLLAALWFGWRSRMASRRAKRLTREQVSLLRDVDSMQQALVPSIPPTLGGLAISVAYEPAAGPAAGGDFYDVFLTESHHVAIVLGDVSGHGRDALTHAALTRYTLRAYLQAGLEPRAALALAGQVLADPASDRFATVAAAVYDASTSTLTYALAGHPPPAMAGFDAPAAVTACASPPVGFEIPTGRRQTTLTLPAGSHLCFFTDGLVEARTNGSLLGPDRLVTLLEGVLPESGHATNGRRASSVARPPSTAAALLACVKATADTTSDDMAACVISPLEPAPAGTPHIEELEADVQLLQSEHAREFLLACHVPRAQIGPLLTRATDLAATHDTAVLRVEIAPNTAHAQVLLPTALPPAPIVPPVPPLSMRPSPAAHPAPPRPDAGLGSPLHRTRA
jgi:hypothetical protein